MTARLVFFLVLGLILMGPAWADDRRVALVVGAASYRHVPRLRNTVNDARSMAHVLRRLGYDVDLLIDPDRAALASAARRLAARAPKADTSLVYFAGHAVQVEGRNWLLPVTARLATAGDVAIEALDVEEVAGRTQAGAPVSMVVLDACRDNPFGPRPEAGGSRSAPNGLKPIVPRSGELVVYASAPGAVALDGTGRNSPFTTALLRHIERPGVEVRDVLSDVRRDVVASTRGQQIPWSRSALDRPFFFKPAPGRW